MNKLFSEGVQKFDIPNAELTLIENFISPELAAELYHDIYNETKWELRKLFMFGKWIDQPRLTALYGDQDKSYSYTGTTFETHPWTEALNKIKSLVEVAADCKITAVLCNLYRDGKDGCGWHSDAGKDDGTNPLICSISLGETRIFQIKHRTDPQYAKPISIPLTAGSLLIMGGEMQHHWQHQVPKTSIATPPRINLTFRTNVGG